MKISMINATFSNFDYLEPLLENLNSQHYKNFELIVCDQNPNTSLKDIIDVTRVNFDVKYIKINTPGLSNARNIGLNAANGDIIGFTDDDCYYSPDLFQKIVEYFEINKQLKILSVAIRSKEDLSLLPFTPIRKKVPITFQNIFETITSVGIFHLNIKNIKFDEKLGLGAEFGSSEEMDYVYQLLINNFHGFYLPELYVMHPQVVNLKEQSLDNIYRRSKGHGAFFKKNNLPLNKSIEIILLRPIGGLIMSIFRLDLKLVKRYQIMLVGRIVGYYLYKT